jgi:RimK family alpha-L-glutamate ligase
VRSVVIAWERTPTNVSLADAAGWPIVTPLDALDLLGPGDVALARLDVRPALDGVEDGMGVLAVLATRGVTLVNGPTTLLATHDKVLTARVLASARVPHPTTRLVTAATDVASCRWSGPVVVKPRFGSRGLHVTLCKSRDALSRHLGAIAHEEWFTSCGAVVQELVPPCGFDLRVVVACGRVVGGIVRIAARGEWRTNVTLGARRVPVEPPAVAQRIAVAAAHAVGDGLVGVDLLPTGLRTWTVIEVNGAVDFTRDYAPGRDVFAETARELTRSTMAVPQPVLVDA